MQLTPLSFALLRTPVQSLDKAQEANTTDPFFEEGIYLASRPLWEEHQKGIASGIDDPKLKLSLSRYRIRSATRCTPFGTFAGCAVVRAAGSTALQLGNAGSHRRHIRLDNSCILAIANALQQVPGIAAQLRFFSNNTIYLFGDEIRYVDFVVKDGLRRHRLSAVKSTPAAKAVLSASTNGAVLQQLICLIVDAGLGSRDEAAAFLQQMIKEQLLYTSLEPAITGDDPFYKLLEQVATLNDIDDLKEEVLSLGKCLKQLSGLAGYQDINRRLDTLRKLFQNKGITLELPQHTLHADLFLKTKMQEIDKDVLQAIAAQNAELQVLARPANNPTLDNFRKRFTARFENAEVPLSLALDSEGGVGYGQTGDALSDEENLLKALLAAETPAPVANDDVSMFVLRKFTACLKAHEKEIRITAEDLEGFRKNAASLRFPASMYLMGSLYRQENRLNESNFQFALSAFGGPSAGSLLGRFTGGDEQLLRLVRAALEEEERAQPDVIFAEIAHLPQTRIGNILMRPTLRRFEIAWAGISGNRAEDQLTVDDLLVSVHDGEVILRSRRWNKRVVPRLSSAHNYSKAGLPVYRFLCDLQFQHYARPATWSWGALSGERHLPRVSYKNIILQKATWRFSESDFAGLPKQEDDRVEWFAHFCAQESMPVNVCLCDGDNTLPLDLSGAEGQALLMHYLRRFKNVRLEEVLFSKENAIVHDEQGNAFNNELIIPLKNNTPAKQTDYRKDISDPAIQRRFHPGAEWLYFKVYSGPKSAEHFLIKQLLPFVEQGLSTARFDQIFFIRYRDEFPHLRIRFHCVDPEKRQALQSAFLGLLAPLLESNTVHAVSIHTYDRELERYGAERIAATEALFHNGSLLVLRLLKLLSDVEESDHYRILLALRTIDALLDEFEITLAEKQSLLQKMAAGYAKEHAAIPALQKKLNEKYRRYQQDIFSHMDAQRDESNGITEATDLLRQHTADCARPICLIRESLSAAPDGERETQRYLSSIIHMFLNRFFPTRQRTYELVLYHFLHKYYSSQLTLRSLQQHTDQAGVC